MATGPSRDSGFVSAVATVVCSGCEKRAEAAAQAMRGHANEMHTAVSVARSGSLTEEQRQDFKTRLLASFNNAQSLWDAYHAHLSEHRIVPELSRNLNLVRGGVL
jgi:hypothetical protein